MDLNFKAALFDLDGTLLHTMRYWRIAPLEFALAHDFRPTTDEWERMYLSSSRKIVMEMCEARGITIPYEQIMHELETFVYHHYLHDARPKKDAVQFLECLKKRNIRMCVATGSPRENALAALSRLNMLDYFDFVAGGYDYSIDKHSSEYFEMMAGMLGVETKQLCVFEDALYSMRAAKAAGCSIVAIDEPTQIKDREMIRECCDLYINNYAEILDMLGYEKHDASE